MKRMLALIALLALSGCAKPPLARTEKPIHVFDNVPQSSVDAQPAVDLIVQVRVWQVTLPIGAVSKNETFWKHVDEHAVDPAIYETLYNNGLRVGIAPTTDWDDLRKTLDATSAVTQRREFTAPEVKATEISMSGETPVLYEVINVLDGNNELTGRIFDKAENLFIMSFEPTRRHLGDVHLRLCPMVRSSRLRLDYSVLNRELEHQYEGRDRLYDMGLAVDVPMNSFLIVAPSASASLPTSVGQNFLTKGGDAARFEQILIFVPQLFRKDPKAMAPTTRR